VTLLYHRAAVREFEKLPPEVRNRVARAVENFYETGRGDIRHIRGELWALAVGTYRVYHGKEAADMKVVGVDHRSRAYIPERMEALQKRLTTESTRGA
jgi:mRNA-degrading endonuclease RelE of RelBE toxin-antitoxin system